MTDGMYLLRIPAATRTTIDGRAAWSVRATCSIAKGAIVILQGYGDLPWRHPTIDAAMRLHDVRTVKDDAGRAHLALVPAAVWTLARPFTVQDALGEGVSYDRESPLVRLSALHEATIRRGSLLGGEVAPVDRQELDRPVRELFLQLWDKAGTTAYDKSEWGRFRSLLEERGIVI